jgi:hypothetical protein
MQVSFRDEEELSLSEYTDKRPALAIETGLVGDRSVQSDEAVSVFGLSSPNQSNPIRSSDCFAPTNTQPSLTDI